MGGGSASIMDGPIPMLNLDEFGSYENYIAARVDGVRATRGTSRLEIIGLLAKTDEDEDGGKESVATGKIGHFVNLSTGSLRELQTGLWGARAWEEMCEAAVFTANEAGAAAHGLKLKPLFASVRVIVDKLLPGGGAQQGGGTATNLSDDLEDEAQPDADAAEQSALDARGENKRPPYSITRRTTGGDAPPAGPASKGKDEKGPGAPARGGAGDGPATKAGSTSTDSRASVLQPTPSTGMKRPAGAPAPKLDASTRDESWYGHSTPTDQAKHAYSTQQTKDKARHLTAELTGLHVKCRMTLRQTLPETITRPAEATDLGPSTTNCIRSALDAQLALAEAILSDLGDLAARGSPSATTILDSLQPDVLDRAISSAIKSGDLRVGLSAGGTV